MNKIRLFFSRVLVFFVKKVTLFYEKSYQCILYNQFKSIGKNAMIELPTSVLGQEFITIGDDFTARRRLKLRAFSSFNDQIFHPEIIIGNNVSIETDCLIGCIHKIVIGDNVLIASRVYISDHGHGAFDYSDIQTPPIKRKLCSKGAMYIGQNVWIGEGATILPGVSIGENCIVGANAVVTKSFPANCVIAGVPAKIIKTF